MCNKVKARIECEKCGYPYSEAHYPDDPEINAEGAIPCDASPEVISSHITEIKRLRADKHYYDCKCLICR